MPFEVQGQAVLDMARATQRLSGSGVTTSSPVGIAGYSNASPVSLARSVRDAHGPSLMVSDDRLLRTVGQLQMVSRGTR